MPARIARPAEVKHVGSSVSVTEFGGNENIDMAEATITGRYPETGFNMNQLSDMVIKVLEGDATIGLKDAPSLSVSTGDIIFIDNETPYFYETKNLRIEMICSPAWTAEQYRNVS